MSRTHALSPGWGEAQAAAMCGRFPVRKWSGVPATFLRYKGCSLIFRQITHDDLGCASYLIGDERRRASRRSSTRASRSTSTSTLARYMGVRIEHILETHNHADHVSGHGRLAAATGATIHIHREAAPEYDARAVRRRLGARARVACVVRAIHTPGHRPEHTAFALIDTARGRRAVGGADRRHAVRRRHRPARSGGRQGGGRARRSSARCTTSC